jgi:thiamine-phosphate pyrophosphorylase
MRPLLTTLARFENAQACALPRLLVLTDEARGYGLDAQLKKWPRGAAFVERTYGKPPTRASYRTKGPLRLATTTPRLAREAGLNGVHWPAARLKHRKACLMGGLIETASAHTGLEIARVRQLGLDGVLISTAFSSNSPSAGRPMGPCRIAFLARMFPNVPLFALGGVNPRTAKRLIKTGLYGVALVSGD